LSSVLGRRLGSATRRLTGASPVDNGGPAPVIFILALRPFLIVVIVIVAVRAVSLHGRRDDNTFWKVASGLEPHGVCPIFDNLHLAIHIDVSVLALDRAVREPGLQLEGSVRSLVAVGVGAVFIVLVNLL